MTTQPNEETLREDGGIVYQSDAVPPQELLGWTQHNSCNGFAFDYLERHDDHDVVVRDGLIDGAGVAHCWVVDRTRDVVVDVTLGQFDEGPDVGGWKGDEHPHACQHEEIKEWTDLDAFESHYEGQTHCDFIR